MSEALSIFIIKAFYCHISFFHSWPRVHLVEQASLRFTEICCLCPLCAGIKGVHSMPILCPFAAAILEQAMTERASATLSPTSLPSSLSLGTPSMPMLQSSAMFYAGHPRTRPQASPTSPACTHHTLSLHSMGWKSCGPSLRWVWSPVELA